MKLRIVLADDNAEFLKMFGLLLDGDFDVVAKVSDGSAAVERISVLQPEVAVIDLEMPLLNGLEVISELKKRSSPTAVVICSVETDADIVQAALNAGAAGYVHKARVAKDLVLAVKAVSRGERFVSSTGV